MKNLLQILILAVMVIVASCKSPQEESDDSTQNDSDSVSVTAVYSTGSACNDIERYKEAGTTGGGVGLSQVIANEAIERYRERNQGKITGFYISKKAIDSLFTTYASANGIWIDLVDPSQIERLDSRDTLGVIISVRNNPHYELKFHSGNAAFISENECPTMCARF